MPAQILDGKALAARIQAELADQVARHRARGQVPGLAVVQVGDDPASTLYTRNKQQVAEQIGFRSERIHLPAETPLADLLALIDRLNADPAVHGILVQAPLPPHLPAEAVYPRIHPAKDVDGFHPVNAGNLWLGRPGLVPCTPLGVMRLIQEAGVDPAGKRAVVVGRSNIVGKPTAALLLHAHATVTLCHSRTQGLPDICRQADILVAAVGKLEFIPGDWIKPGAVVIDVGINPVPGYKTRVRGDVHFESAREVAGWITPVPGGVGPMTIAMLMHNTLAAARALWGEG